MSDLSPIPQAPEAEIPARRHAMMAQYLAIKRAHADCLLFYRWAISIEMFFEDASMPPPPLDIALTKRGRHAGEDIACRRAGGVARSLSDAPESKGLPRRVCEQMETRPKPRSAGQIGVERAVGPCGDARHADRGFGCSIRGLIITWPPWPRRKANLGLAWLDLSTGDFAVQGGRTNRWPPPSPACRPANC